MQRISLSVLVDGVTDEAQLATLESVVAAAVGIDETRGDILEVQTLTFDRSAAEDAAAEMTASEKTDNNWRIVYIVAGVIFLLMLLWYVQRLLNNLRLASSQAWTPVLKPVGEMALPAPNAAALPGDSAPQLAAMAAAAAAPTASNFSIEQPHMPEIIYEPAQIPTMTAADEQMQRNVIGIAEENPAAIAEIIQIWLNEDDK